MSEKKKPGFFKRLLGSLLGSKEKQEEPPEEAVEEKAEVAPEEPTDPFDHVESGSEFGGLQGDLPLLGEQAAPDQGEHEHKRLDLPRVSSRTSR